MNVRIFESANVRGLLAKEAIPSIIGNLSQTFHVELNQMISLLGIVINRPKTLNLKLICT